MTSLTAPSPKDNFSLTLHNFLAVLGASYILVLLVSGQPVDGDATASWGIIFQLTRFDLIQPCNRTSNQKRSNLKRVCEKATRHFIEIPNRTSLNVEQTKQAVLQQTAGPNCSFVCEMLIHIWCYDSSRMSEGWLLHNE
jgi:hypothetical protein